MNTLNEFSAFPWRGDAPKKLAVLMSGGVDSSVAALLLRRQGFDAVGVTMDLFGEESAAVGAAADVCRALSIPHLSVNVSGEFRRLVVSPFCGAYEAGETPNPCAVCNERVKFGIVIDLMERAWGKNFEIATGHYARIVREEGKSFLARARYRKKDQSYFLSGIRGDLLQRLHFPLGELSCKEEVREIARRAALPAAEKPESMEICFAAEEDYRSLTSGGRPGPIVDRHGKVLGTHKGLTGYTPGQRKGLGIASPHPLFVIEIRTGDNTLVVAPREDAFTKNVTAGCVNALIEDELREGNVLYGKIRSQGEPAACKIISAGNGALAVGFSEPVFAPAPGQRLVLYTAGGRVAAGGVIARREI